MLASPEVRQAIKDSRGKCRSRWQDITREIARMLTGRMADISRPVQVSGHGWFTDDLWPERGHSRRGHGRGHGLDRLQTRMRSRTGRGHARLRTGHGPGSDTDCPETRTVRGRGVCAPTEKLRMRMRTSARPFGRTNGDFSATVSRTPKPSLAKG